MKNNANTIIVNYVRDKITNLLRSQYIKMCICGLVTLVAQLIIFNILRFLFSTVIANAIAVEVSIILNFFANNYYTFHNERFTKQHGKAHILHKIVQFNMVALFSLAIQLLIMSFGIRLFGDTALSANLLLLIGVTIGSIANIYLYKTRVWNTSTIERA